MNGCASIVPTVTVCSDEAQYPPPPAVAVPPPAISPSLLTTRSRSPRAALAFPQTVSKRSWTRDRHGRGHGPISGPRLHSNSNSSCFYLPTVSNKPVALITCKLPDMYYYILPSLFFSVSFQVWEHFSWPHPSLQSSHQAHIPRPPLFQEQSTLLARRQ